MYFFGLTELKFCDSQIGQTDISGLVMGNSDLDLHFFHYDILCSFARVYA